MYSVCERETESGAERFVKRTSAQTEAEMKKKKTMTSLTEIVMLGNPLEVFGVKAWKALTQDGLLCSGFMSSTE